MLMFCRDGNHKMYEVHKMQGVSGPNWLYSVLTEKQASYSKVLTFHVRKAKDSKK